MVKEHRRLQCQPYEPGAEPSCSISAASARTRQSGAPKRRANLILAARSARSGLRAERTTTDAIVNGNPKIRFEKLTRYMSILPPKAPPYWNMQAGVAGSLAKGRVSRMVSLAN
jgi:hypothetical protein